MTAADAVCRDAHLVHCHGTYLRHVDGGEECTGTGCGVPPEGHLLVVDCTELIPPCGCAGAG